MSKLLLIIDLQKEFENPIYHKCLDYIKNSNYDLVIGTYFKNSKTSNFYKMLDWLECMGTSKDSVEYNYDILYAKNTYAFYLSDTYKDWDIDIIGQDTDACILATCFDLFDRGFKFNVLSDYIYTPISLPIKELYKRQFGDVFR